MSLSVLFNNFLSVFYFYAENLTNKFNTMTPQEKENILNALKREYRVFKELEKMNTKFKENYRDEYTSIRSFCLDTQLVSFNDIEGMEYEVNQSF